jgi:hypothetical protein
VQTRAEGQTVPIIKLDNLSDPFATQLTVEYGKKPGEQLVLETVRAKLIQVPCMRATLANARL